MASFNPHVVVDTGDTLKGLTATIVITTRRWTKFRVVLGLLVVRFGCWIMGVGNIETVERP